MFYLNFYKDRKVYKFTKMGFTTGEETRRVRHWSPFNICSYSAHFTGTYFIPCWLYIGTFLGSTHTVQLDIYLARFGDIKLCVHFVCLIISF